MPRPRSRPPSSAAVRSRTKTKAPRSGALPGMEDHAIKALDDVAASYADIRDQRMELTRDAGDDGSVQRDHHRAAGDGRHAGDSD